MNALFKELKERSVYRIAASYAVAAWLILQLAAIVIQALNLASSEASRIVLSLLVAGFSGALWAGWWLDHRGTAGGAASSASRGRHLAFAALSVLPILLGGFLLLHHTVAAPGPDGLPNSPPIPDKSIAVLPFESFSADQDNAYFADGIQDEILTDLAKIADLKVISRTSVMPYRAGGARNSREIGQALGVSKLLEGSVQRDAGKIRVTAQLIDARADSHLWAEHYDRQLQDIFAIQTEVAEKIVASLKATLSPDEKAALKEPPTEDPEAFDLYLQANELINGFAEGADWREPLLKALRLLEAATGRDPNFALAFCLTARAHDSLYWFNLDHTPARLAQAQSAVADALRLRPNLGEAHLAQALVNYHGARDFAAALRELAVARVSLPNYPLVYSLSSWIARRQGRWPDSVRDAEKAATLDPRNPDVLTDLTVLFDLLRSYQDENRVADTAIRALPQSAPYFRLVKAQLQAETGQLPAAHLLLQAIPSDYDPSGATTFTHVQLALYERHFAEAAAALAASKLDGFDSGGTILPRAWLEGLIARAGGQRDKAKADFLSARNVAAAGVAERPDDAYAWALLGQIDAALERKDDALREGSRAVELRPVKLDAVEGPAMETSLALIRAWTGDLSSAVDDLIRLSVVPGGPDYGFLSFDPVWDALRGDPRFTKLLTTMTPASVRE